MSTFEFKEKGGPSGSTLSYRHLSYRVDAKGKGGGSKLLLDDVSVTLRAGELLAIMGPSGAGKSTLLDLMAFRKPALDGAEVTLNNTALTAARMQQMSTFVEQEDALLGVLTVRETVTYALRLHLPLLPLPAAAARVDRVLSALGLQSCAHQRIGTPIARGVSGGQKRRVTAACAMVTYPRILLLDEVTSGLDSTAALSVLRAIRALARAEGILVAASIHQPSLQCLSQFTSLLLLAEGRLCWNGRVEELEGFLGRWGRGVGRFTTPSDHAMSFLNADFPDPESDSEPDSSFDAERGTARERGGNARAFREFYLSELNANSNSTRNASGRQISHGTDFGVSSFSSSSSRRNDEDKADREHDREYEHGKAGPAGTLFWNTVVLSERTALNYGRNLLAYGVRAGMYAGMGLMLATIWIRLGTADSTINDRLSVHFYSVAFLAFMSVAGIPGFLEERAVYYRETKNGLYTTLPFVLANTLVGMPFLGVCTLLFTLISYWAIGLHSGGGAFFRFLAFLYLAILAAESQMLVVAALMPMFVAALAIGAFVNGFWMSVGGYFIKARSLPRFWFYSFHYMDYQRYAFELLTNSDLRDLTFACPPSTDGGACVCAYPSSTPETCTVSGADVLDYLDIGGISYGAWAGIVIGITVIYRIALYFALKARSK
ncbi:P-loop containing nucleoside triphosphate hydrolase protein [Mycena albidolilacea]|uniref:P-loop containing nucleoside triphosphate hydrolase protein n=1 Tax=Mycena albidolilacea TaxID=1033008 RepID=A0AAD7E764_9AGAR|nr:P-loop containing nucleoside triphosphate hydrolase protein [Mycena albidolilacea]